MLAFTRKPIPDDARAELLLDDADDALVPLSSPALTDAPAAAVGRGRVVALSASLDLTSLPAPALAELVAWLCCPEPSFGWRRALFVVSGINLGPCASERRLRLLLCDLYRAFHPSTRDHSKERSC